jgi:short subunit dehydrogenase-like uncharacterized protein
MSQGYPFMIYGANGYTGRIITQLAVERGMKPLLCGRNEAAIAALATQYKLPYEIADLNDKAALDDAVLSVDAVLHCAGPFSQTARQMLESCMRNKTHYLDITGEIAVFEMVAGLGESIKQSGIMALPGIGFDVVPTDCLAAYLHQKLPTATQLTLAFAGLGGGVSHGTASTMLENIDKGSAVRIDGSIKTIPSASKSRLITFDKKPLQTVSIGWGDVSTAYYSTGIPNIEVYMAVNDFMLRGMEYANMWVFRQKWIKRLIQKGLDTFLVGPSTQQRQKAKSIVWGEVRDLQGNSAIARLITPEGYTLTALTALAAIEKVLKGNAPIGFQTPSKAYGANFILEIKDTKRQDLGTKRDIEIS